MMGFNMITKFIDTSYNIFKISKINHEHHTFRITKIYGVREQIWKNDYPHYHISF